MAGKRIALGVLALAATVCFLALGVWQIERRAWKLDLMARVEARVHAPAVPLPPARLWPAVNEGDDAYRKIQVSGVLLNACETRVQALTVLGAGYWIMTPFRTEDGPVLVNRGFVPSNDPTARARQAAPSDGPATITGLLRMSEPKGGFLRSNDPAAGHWFSRDVEAITRACGLTGAAPFFIDADGTPNPGGYPVGGLTVVAFHNAHLVYALTWFALAALSAFGLVLLFRAEAGR